MMVRKIFKAFYNFYQWLVKIAIRFVIILAVSFALFSIFTFDYIKNLISAPLLLLLLVCIIFIADLWSPVLLVLIGLFFGIPKMK